MAVNVDVTLSKFDDIDSALRALKKKMNKTGLSTDMKRHECYIPPSLRRRNKAAKARAKVRKKIKKHEEQELKFEKRRQDDPLRGVIK